jgi:hypothetical protein
MADPDTRIPPPGSEPADVPDPPAAHDDGPARKDLTPTEVYDLLKAGKPIVNARVKRLKFRGEIPYRVEFRNCQLIALEFDSVTFLDDVKFIGCTLERPTFNRQCVFEKLLDFGSCTLNKALIARVTVKGLFSCGHTEFKGKLTFAECVFLSKVNFWEAKFHCWVDIKGCEFHGEADFRSLHADQGFNLTKSVFHDNFVFRGSNVEKKFQADGSTFEKLLDLSKAKLHDFCYLEGIVQGTAMRFAFLNALATRILVKPEQLDGRLASEEAGDHATAMHEYGLLKKCYQEQHRFDCEDWAFYRFKVNQRRAKSWTLARPWTAWRTFGDWLFLDVGCGYGTNPARAIRTAAIIILAFAVLYATRVEMFYTEKPPFPPDIPATADEMQVKALNKEAAKWPENRVMIGLITSVSVFTSGMGGIREIAQGWMNVPVMVESIMGTLLFGLFIVAFSRKVIR